MTNLTDEEIKKTLEGFDESHLEQALRHLRQYEGDVQNYLADCVAAICGVKKNDMFTNNKKEYYVHARWLFWYAYRYMTNESYDKIAYISSANGHHFVLRTIQSCTGKMAMMIESEPLWKKRWMVIKRIIKLYNSMDSDKQTDNTIVVQIPRNLKDTISIKIHEK
jgi:chromosomal replication initiation ATPase DnaA